MAKDMRNGNILLLLCNIAFFISQFHFGYTSPNPSSFSNNNNVTCIESERKALLEFKARLDDAANRLASWTTAEDCCNWAGVTCNSRTGHVQKLQLRNPIEPFSEFQDNYDSYSNNCLGGEINPSILNLEHLNYLDLSSNDFSWIPIPTFLGSLKNLRYLNLTGAGFSGEIPPHLGNLSHLQYLCLGSNDLSSKSFMWITRLVSLKALDLSWTNLTESVDWWYSINMLPSLSSLSLRHCGTIVGTNLSPTVNLTSLVSLDLGENDLTSNSTPFFSLLNVSSQIEVLRLDHNQLQDPIPIISEKLLPALTVLDVSFNNFNSPSMLLSLCNHTNLVSLDLHFNQLQGSLPSCLGNLTSLRVLDLSVNMFGGKIPSELGHHLIQLTSLDLSSNQFKSSIPSSFGQLSKLKSLYLSNNQLHGVIPSTIGQLSKLKILYISENSLSGELPATIGQLSELEYFYISNNSLTGEMPSTFGQLRKLKHFYISGNSLTGDLPSTLGQLCKLEYFYISENSLTGEMPSTLGQLSKLKHFYISENSLTGELPTTLGQLVELQELDISRNSFTGELSESHFEKLKSLKYLSISHNYFLSFVVSSQWVPPFQLQEIDMDSVFLGPQFPPWLQIQKDVVTLSMKNASISGVIPAWFLTSCSSVQTLDLSYNNIHGSLMSIPPNLESLVLSNNLFTSDMNSVMIVSLKTLQLDNNLLGGNIPNDLCNLSHLLVLSLANNQLTGNIPPCFGNLGKLEVLDLANNSINGHIPSSLGNLLGLSLLKLSRNKLYGALPSSLKNLKYLMTLDLGENQLTSTIPEWIGKELSSLVFLRLQSNNFYGNISVHLCQLSLLHILNLAENNLVGRIPHCFGNFRGMILPFGEIFYVDSYTEELWNIIKGIELQYSSNLDELISISLSGNNLQGEIPTELMILEGLQSLNLSNNKLSGRIPEKIGKLKHLESLDLAKNGLAGPIPQNLSSIDSLGFLNLSFNNLVGRIPTGNHFDTLSDPSIYEGNIGLCGKPIARSCPDNNTPPVGNPPAFHKNIDEGFEMPWFYSGMGTGFGVGFVGVLGILCWKKSWRYAYFRFVDAICDKVWACFAVKIF